MVQVWWWVKAEVDEASEVDGGGSVWGPPRDPVTHQGQGQAAQIGLEDWVARPPGIGASGAPSCLVGHSRLGRVL